MRNNKKKRRELRKNQNHNKEKYESKKANVNYVK